MNAAAEESHEDFSKALRSRDIGVSFSIEPLDQLTP